MEDASDSRFPIKAGRRVFSLSDQDWFADLSGDRNPIHLDRVAARRTQAGDVVVHGVHTLLWCMNAIALELESAALASLRAKFQELICVGDLAEAVITEIDSRGFRAEVRVGERVAVRLSGIFGEPKAGTSPNDEWPVITLTESAQDLALLDMEACRGRVASTATLSALTEAFPGFVRLWGAARISALCASTYVVGMECPGLHSIFGGLTAEAEFVEPGNPYLDFRTTMVDTEYRAVRLAMRGLGLKLSVESFSRHPPTAQPTIDTVAARVQVGEFSGASALVIGGSRGLGETVAKILATGGAAVTITYALGVADADRVRAEIVGAGGRCEIRRYDVLAPAAAQLGWAQGSIDTAYYFATPTIAKRDHELFSRARFDQLATYYLDGFCHLSQALATDRAAGVAIFYPSTSFIEERPSRMSEYAMAKAAGEVLCQELAARHRNLDVMVERVPRLSSDQTASLVEVETGDPLDYFLPIVRALHARRRASA
jgi:acyl dehydratase